MMKKQLLCFLVISVLLVFSACQQNPEPAGFDLPPDAEIIPVRPDSFSRILIRKPNSPTGYLVTDPEIISAFQAAHDEIMDLFGCGCGMGLYYSPDDEAYQYGVTGFEGGWELGSWHYLDPELFWSGNVPNVGADLAEIMDRALSNAVEVNVYSFLANDPHKHGETMYGINSRIGSYAFFAGYLTDQYSVVELKYSYDNAKNEYKDAPHEANIGHYACDDIFIPVVDHVREKSNLYQLSKAETSRASHSESLTAFERRICIYLNYPISSEERSELEKMWSRQIEKKSYYNEPSWGLFEYTEVTQYPVTVLSERALSIEDISELEQEFSLELAVE